MQLRYIRPPMPTDEEQLQDGLRFIPMEYTLQLSKN